MEPEPNAEPVAPSLQPPSQKKPIIWIALSCIFFCTTLFFAYTYIALSKTLKYSQVRTYDECQKAQGSVIRESYPSICVTVDGKQFIQPISDGTQTPLKPTSTDSIDLPQSESDDWKLYSNTVYAFSFKYPKDWKVSASPVSQDQLNIIVDKQSNTSEQGFVPIQFSVNMATDSNGAIRSMDTLAKAKEYYTRQFDTRSVSIEDVSIADRPGISITGVLAGPGPGEGNFIHVTLVDIGDQILIAQLGNKTYQTMFDKILTTLTVTGADTISTCIYKGSTYTHGQSFKDACNTCSCTSGKIACTLMACANQN